MSFLTFILQDLDNPHSLEELKYFLRVSKFRYLIIGNENRLTYQYANYLFNPKSFDSISSLAQNPFNNAK